jgi:predicted nucleic acid-binding protein
MIVFDTNVISEVLRPAPEPAVLAWLRSVPRREIWTCTIVLAELFSGVDLMPVGKRQQRLREKMEQLVPTLFMNQILLFDLSAARAYGPILAARQATGRPIDEIDAQIAAIAKVHGAALATRNIRDFEHCGIQIVNPWQTV